MEELELVLYVSQGQGAYHRAMPGVKRSFRAAGEGRIFGGVCSEF